MASRNTKIETSNRLRREIYAANSKTSEENSFLGLLARYLVFENNLRFSARSFCFIYIKTAERKEKKVFRISKMFNAITFKQFSGEKRIFSRVADETLQISNLEFQIESFRA